MKIKLTCDWMGNRKGAVLDLVPTAANQLINRKVAEIYYGDDDRLVTMPKEQPQSKVATKQVGEAPADKMVHQAENKGIFKRRTVKV